MVRYLVRRLLWTVVLFFGVTLVAFVLFKLVPGDPALLAAGPNATADQVERMRYLLELDEPTYMQYWHFLQRLVVDHSLGTSLSGRDVNDIVAAAAPVSASVVLGGMLLWLSLGVPLGILSALRPRSLGDRVGRIFVLVGISLHPLVLGLVLAYVFGYRLGWTPITGYCTFVTHPGQLCG